MREVVTEGAEGDDVEAGGPGEGADASADWREAKGGGRIKDGLEGERGAEERVRGEGEVGGESRDEEERDDEAEVFVREELPPEPVPPGEEPAGVAEEKWEVARKGAGFAPLFARAPPKPILDLTLDDHPLRRPAGCAPRKKGGRSRVTQSRKIVAGCFVPSETTWAHFSTARSAISSRTVNTTLTLRNWAIGFYIREYEQNGSDRAKYGREVLGRVAERLSAAGLEELTARYLRLCRQFASVYSWIWRSLTAQSGAEAIGGAAADQHAIVLVQSLKTATVSP